MPKTNFSTVDEYIATFPQETQRILEQVRRAIKEAVPQAEEVISYQIPAFKFHGWVFYFAAYKNHYSLSCPPPFTVFRQFEADLSPYEVSKSAIRFSLNEPVPAPLIRRMSKYRAEQNLNREKPRPEKG